MSNGGRGRRGRPRKDRRTPSDSPDDSNRATDTGWQDGQEEHGGVERSWRRNLRRREPSTPENSWLATQPEFQRYWGEHSEAEFDTPVPPDHVEDEPHTDQDPAPQEASRPRQRLRRKPADISTLMARYTARAEEQENFALPPPSRRRQPPPAQPPERGNTLQHQIQGPAPVRKKAPDPKFVASPLPAEMPEAEPGRPAQSGSVRISKKVIPAPASAGTSGTIIVSDGQVRVVEEGGEAGDARPPEAAEDESMAQPSDRPAQAHPGMEDPEPEISPEYNAQGEFESEPHPVSPDEPDIRHLQMPADAANIDWQDQEAGADLGDHGEYIPEPPHAPAVPGLPPRKWPVESGVGATHEPVRFDGPLPYQDAGHVPQEPSLADWDAANERLEFEPAWHAREGGMGFGGKFLMLLLVLGIAGAGYVVWSGKTGQLVDFASTFVNALGSTPGEDGEQAVSQAPEAPASVFAPVGNVTPPAGPAIATPQAEPSTITLPAGAEAPVAPAPDLGVNPGDRVASDPNMTTRQIEGPAPQTTTLWWKPKTVTLFPALTPAELAGQPELPSARGESVMAPSGPLSGTATPAPPVSSANAAEIARINELIQSFDIKNAENSIAPLLAGAPGEPAYLMLSGRAALAKSSNLQALATFDKVLAADPGNTDAKTARGRALANLGRGTEAQAIAAEILAENSNHLGALWLSVEAQSAMGALSAALEICGRIEGAGAEPGSAEWCRGVANKRARRPLQAETMFASALQSGSRDFVAMRQLYFRFKGYFNGTVDGFPSESLMAAATRCTAVRDCNTAGI